ncbi:MAG: pyridoxamine 5'-phosphate oxidase family protein [Trebonia sp.]|uniref:pyridoxamine 5'-phosphate oxidase family protein n=1 Tax=Trebonia sp. TaxID=2767075 RepID=UPI003BAFDC1A
MSQTEPVAELNESFSEPGASAPPWTDVTDVLTSSEMFWLSTARRDGRPHVTPLPAIWLDGTLYFCTGSQEQKTANLRANPGCVLTTGSSDLRSGLDVVVEGTAVRTTDVPRLHELAAIWKSKLDWDYEVTDDGFRDGAGRTGLVFGVTPAKILGFGKAPYTQTRYRFPD